MSTTTTTTTAANSNSANSKNDKKKLEEKAIKVLRDLGSLPFNKQCNDCNQKGPTYVNITMGTFVCTTCSGILRGLNPPHRVKSINMATFTPEEVEFMKTRGNHYCQLVFMSLFDTTTGAQPDSRDSEKLRDFLMQKYERKKWYTAPTDALVHQIKHENENINYTNNNLTNNMSKLKLSSNTRPSSSTTTTITTHVVHQPQQVHLNTNNFKQQTSPNSKVPTTSNDLFSSFDAFSSSTSDSTSTNSTSSNFANFANFDLFENFSQPSTATTTTTTAIQAAPVTQQPNLFNNSQAIITPQQNNNNNNLFATSQPTKNSNSDKYSALAELDSIFQTPTSSAPAATAAAPPASQPFSNGGVSNGHHQQATNPFSNLTPSVQPNLFLNNAPQVPVPAGPFNYYSQVGAPTAPNMFQQQAPFTNMFPSMSQQHQQQPNAASNINPFITIAKQQSQIQKPKTNSTNPFL